MQLPNTSETEHRLGKSNAPTLRGCTPSRAEAVQVFKAAGGELEITAPGMIINGIVPVPMLDGLIRCMEVRSLLITQPE